MKERLEVVETEIVITCLRPFGVWGRGGTALNLCTALKNVYKKKVETVMMAER
jgi:hypothetical protein